MISGGIIMWSGSIATIPAGYSLCDGNNGTPDLRDKFIIGARSDDGGVAKTLITGMLTQTGGSSSHEHQLTGNLSASGAGAFLAVENGSSSDLVSHLPDYFALAYIMKL